MSLALLLALACSQPVPEVPQVERSAVLIYTNNLDGETEPCG